MSSVKQAPQKETAFFEKRVMSAPKDYQEEQDFSDKCNHFFSLIRNNKLQEFKNILDNEPDAVIRYQTHQKETALHIIAENNRPEMMALFLNHLTAFLAATSYLNETQTAQERFKRILNQRRSDGYTALMVASDKRAYECSELLLAQKPDLYIEEYDSHKNVLHFAAENGDLRMVKMLHNAGMDLECPVDKDGKKKFPEHPIHFASRSYASDLVVYLTNQNINLNIRGGFDGLPPVLTALNAGCIEIAGILNETGKIDYTQAVDKCRRNVFHYLKPHIPGSEQEKIFKKKRKKTDEDKGFENFVLNNEERLEQNVFIPLSIKKIIKSALTVGVFPSEDNENAFKNVINSPQFGFDEETVALFAAVQHSKQKQLRDPEEQIMGINRLAEAIKNLGNQRLSPIKKVPRRNPIESLATQQGKTR